MTDSASPGYYSAQGDPPGTVRYWDGVQWTSDPMPAPPGWRPDVRPGDERFATVWVRIGAAMIDGLISAVVTFPFMIPYFIDVFEDLEAGGDGTTVQADLPAYVYLVSVGVTVTWVLCVAFFGGTPGKLMLGLRVTLADGRTTPPGLAPAALRSLPGLAGVVPIVGPLVRVGFVIASLIMVCTDPERRSAYDRIAGTRVVHKRLL